MKRSDRELQTVAAKLDRVLFFAFAFCWLFFFQRNLEHDVHQMLTEAAIVYHPFILSLIFSLLVTAIELPFAKLLGFKGMWNAVNYIPSALILGACTAHTEEFFFGHSLLFWIIATVISAAVIAFFKFLSELLARNDRGSTLQTAAVNLLLISGICMLSALLANTDETQKRESRVAAYMAAGNYEKALKVGLKSEETSLALTIDRIECMAQLETDGPDGSGLGSRLFLYPIPSEYAGRLWVAMIPDSCSAEQLCNRQLAAMLIRKDVKAFAESMTNSESPVNLNSWADSSLPVFYLQALVTDSLQKPNLEALYPGQYEHTATEYAAYDSVKASLAGHPDSYVRNTLYKRYSTTYWFYLDF